MNTEVWKDIIGLEGAYQVSDFGAVKRLGKKTSPNSQIRKDRKKYIPEIILSQRKRAGYLSVSLQLNKKSHDFVAHRLVAIAFVPNPENKPHINHIDGNKLNNHFQNLEWCSHQENMLHAKAMGLVASGERGSNKLSEENVLEVFRLRAAGVPGKQIAEKYGLHKNAIYHILNGKNWRSFAEKNGVDLKKIKEAKKVNKKNTGLSRPVLKCSMSGEVLEEFPSLNEVGRKLKYSIGAISVAIKIGSVSHGYRWKYKR